MTREKILTLIFNKEWPVITDLSFEDLVALLNYPECMSLAYDLFFENLFDDDLQDFAVRLLFFIREHFIKEWEVDWKNDAFLGKLCGLTWRYEERYECLKRAYNKLDDPPDSLLLSLSGCNSAPGVPPISDNESEVFLKRALRKKVTYEAALKMRALAKTKKNSQEEKYWGKMCNELKERNIRTDMMVPDIFQNKISKR